MSELVSNAMSNIVADNYNIIYHLKLKYLFERTNPVSKRWVESFNDTFMLTDPLNNMVYNKARAFREEFTMKYAEWIWKGKTDISELHEFNPNAKKFDSEYEGRFASYGPRVAGQLRHVIDELKHDRNSRRACIMILDERDQIIAKGLRKGETKCEYPCTMGLTFFIREDKLQCHAVMRSNNYATTVCIDVFLFTTFQKWIAEALDCEIGNYYHCAVNSHILEQDYDRAKAILEAYCI